MKGKDDLFLESLSVRVAKTISKEFVEPYGDEKTWYEAIAKDYKANSKAQYALTQALNDDDLHMLLIANRLLKYGMI